MHLKHLTRLASAYFTYQKAVFLKSTLFYNCRVHFVRFLPSPPSLACHPSTLGFWRKLGVNTTEARGVRKKSCRYPMGISQINRLAGLSYVPFWNINKTFERRGEEERERQREQDMAWWSLMFYWTDTNYFGPGLHCLVEVSEKASRGMPWAQCGDERGAVCDSGSEAESRIHSTYLFLFWGKQCHTKKRSWVESLL